MVENKKLPVAIGIMAMNSDVVAKVNSGTAVENIHFLGDGLWDYTSEPIKQ
jgi:predicted RNA-binding protein (TIGR00451 family)